MIKLHATSVTGNVRVLTIDLVKGKLDGGGGGTVFVDAQSGLRAIKLLKALIDPETGKLMPDYKAKSGAYERRIKTMLRNAPAQTFSDGDDSICQIAWPIETLTLLNGAFVGFTMPRLDLSKMVRFESFYTRRGLGSIGLSQDLRLRLGLCANLATMVSKIHEKKHAIVDLHAENIRIERAHARVALIDCDGYSIWSPTEVFPAELVRLEKAAPELVRDGPVAGNQFTDQFALAFHIFQTLNLGTSPYSVVEKTGVVLPAETKDLILGGFYGFGLNAHPKCTPRIHSSHKVWPVELRQAFDRAFAGKPDQRPTANEWAVLCKKYYSAADTCSVDPVHGHSVIDGKCWECSWWPNAKVVPAATTQHQPLVPSSNKAGHVAAAKQKIVLPAAQGQAIAHLQTAARHAQTKALLASAAQYSKGFFDYTATRVVAAAIVLSMCFLAFCRGPSYDEGVAAEKARSSSQQNYEMAREVERQLALRQAQIPAPAPVPTASPVRSLLADLQNGQVLDQAPQQRVSTADVRATPSPVSETGRSFGNQHHGEKGTRYAVTSGGINIRSEAGPEEPLSGFDPLTFGTKVRVLRRQISDAATDNLPKFWFLIETMDGTDRRGWVNSELLRKFLPDAPVVDATTGKTPDFTSMTKFDFAQSFESQVKSQGLNMRATPGPLNPLVAKLSQGDTLVALYGADLFTRDGTKIAEWWFAQLPDGREGWINAEFVD